jgi:hypothetical protein
MKEIDEEALRAAGRHLRRMRLHMNREAAKSTLSAPMILRHKLVQAASAARLMSKKRTYREAVRLLAKKDSGLAAARSDASRYLPLVRFFRLDENTTTANRNTQILEICVREKWSEKGIRREIIQRGPTALIKSHPRPSVVVSKARSNRMGS